MLNQAGLSQPQLFFYSHVSENVAISSNVVILRTYLRNNFGCRLGVTLDFYRDYSEEVIKLKLLESNKIIIVYQAVFFTTEAIRDFLRGYGKGQNSKDYEFLVAVMLKNFCEKQWGEECKIGFEFKPETMRNLPDKGTLSLPEVVKLFREGMDENTPFDCSIVKNKPNTKGVIEGCPFQIKRFGIGREKADTQILIDYINSLRYQKTQACLLVVLDGNNSDEIEFAKIKDEVDIDNFPFSRLMFGWMKDGKVSIGEVYPKYGMEEYNPLDMIK